MSLTSLRAIHLFPVALLLLHPVFGQQSGASPQPATPVNQPSAATAPSLPTAPAVVPSQASSPVTQLPNPSGRSGLTPQQSNGPVYVSGRVITDDGRPLASRVTIESVCDGQTHTEGYTDGKGDFGVRVGDKSNGIIQDASVSSSTDDYANGPPNLFAPACEYPTGDVDTSKPITLVYPTCVIRAKLSGYWSDTIGVSNRSVLDDPNVGTLVLHKVGQVDGRLVSAASLAAPKNARAAFEKGQKALKKNEQADARQDFEDATKIYPAYATAWLELGKLSTNRGDLDGALTSYQAAVQADPKFVGPYLNLSAIELVKKQWPQLAETTGALLRLDAYDYPQAYYMNALANFNLRNVDVAEKSARQAEKLDTQGRYPGTWVLLESILASRHAFPEAAEQLRQYLKFAPQAPDAPSMRAQLSQLEALSVTAAKASPAP